MVYVCREGPALAAAMGSGPSIHSSGCRPSFPFGAVTATLALGSLRQGGWHGAAADPDLVFRVEESSGSIVSLRRIDASELTSSSP